MTFQEIQRYVYRRTGHPDTPVTEVSDRIKQSINQRHRQILGREGMNRLRQTVVTFASNTSDHIYSLGQQVSRILGIHERDNDVPLDYMTLEDFRAVQSDPSGFEGTPAWYTELGFQAVAKQPSDASELFLVSSSASDTALTATLELLQDQGLPRTVTSPNLTGTTGVSADTAVKDATQVMNFFLSAAPVGQVTLREDAGDTTGTDLAVINIGDTKSKYKQIALVPKPSSAITYYADVEIAVRDMTAANDEPMLPEDYHWVLAEYALHDEMLKKEKKVEADAALIQALDGIKALKNYVTNPPDFLPVQGAERFRGVSRLGPFFPADRIIG